MAADGLSLVRSQSRDALTVGGELNKLAANVALGRNAAGVHWRSEALDELLLGPGARHRDKNYFPASRHRKVGNICTPDLIDVGNVQTP